MAFCEMASCMRAIFPMICIRCYLLSLTGFKTPLKHQGEADNKTKQKKQEQNETEFEHTAYYILYKNDKITSVLYSRAYSFEYNIVLH